MSVTSNRAASEAAPAIDLAGVGVRYRLPRTGLRSIKEFALLSLRRRVVFDDFWALRQVDLTVRPGERLGILGRNGAGKSTLLQVIARVVAPTTGRATVNGRIAPLLQLGAGFDGELTGRENVFLNGGLLGMQRAEIAARFDDIVEFAELRDFIDVPLRAYSSGMAARLGFAVATAAEPDILLLDEVLAVGDEAFKAKCLARMQGFSDRGTTLVLVTHDPELVLDQCSRAIWIEAGQIRAAGEPATVLDAYHAFLAERMPAPFAPARSSEVAAAPEAVDAPEAAAAPEVAAPEVVDAREATDAPDATPGSGVADAIPVILGANPIIVSPGDSVTVWWSGIPEPSAKDWVGLFRAGAPSDASHVLAWRYVNGTRHPTGPVPWGGFHLAIPTTPGSYEFRLFANDGYRLVQTSDAVKVATVDSLSASPSSAAPGGRITVTWSGISSPTATDWIGLFAVGAPGDKPRMVEAKYVNGSEDATCPVPSGSCSFASPTTPGAYEFRLYANDTYILLKRSQRVQILSETGDRSAAGCARVGAD